MPNPVSSSLNIPPFCFPIPSEHHQNSAHNFPTKPAKPSQFTRPDLPYQTNVPHANQRKCSVTNTSLSTSSSSPFPLPQFRPPFPITLEGQLDPLDKHSKSDNGINNVRRPPVIFEAVASPVVCLADSGVERFAKLHPLMLLTLNFNINNLNWLL